jgi:hypothetical protein
MLLTKTFLVAAAIAGGLLASPPAAAGPRRIPEPPPWPVLRTQHCFSAATIRPVEQSPESKERSRPSSGLLDGSDGVRSRALHLGRSRSAPSLRGQVEINALNSSSARTFSNSRSRAASAG